MKVHFQTFVVACVKLKKNVARAKKTVFTIIVKKKKKVILSLAVQKK